MKLFLQKNAKFSSAGGSAPRPPSLRQLGASPPDPPNSPPHCEFLATRLLEAKAKDTKKVRGQGQPFRGQNLSRPRTEMLEAKAKDQGLRRKRSPKKKVFKIFFQAISNLLAYPEFLIGGGLKHKSHAMTSSKFFQRGSFCGTKIP